MFCLQSTCNCDFNYYNPRYIFPLYIGCTVIGLLVNCNMLLSQPNIGVRILNIMGLLVDKGYLLWWWQYEALFVISGCILFTGFLSLILLHFYCWLVGRQTLVSLGRKRIMCAGVIMDDMLFGNCHINLHICPWILNTCSRFYGYFWKTEVWQSFKKGRHQSLLYNRIDR